MESLRSKSDPSERIETKEKLISLHSARDSLAAEDVVDKYFPGTLLADKTELVAMVREGISIGTAGGRSVFHSFWGEMIDRIQEKQIEFGDSWR
jgi:hypothetical protein